MAIDRDPSSELSAKLWRVRVAGAIVLTAVGIWALWPQETAESRSLAAARTTDARSPEGVKWIAPNLTRKLEPLNVKAFDAQLWKFPPKPIEVAAAPPPPPPPPPPPLKLQLVGILTDEPQAEGAASDFRGPRAALFDPDSNKVYSVPVGGTVLRYRVKAISTEIVELVDAQLPALPPYVLKMRSTEFKPTPVVPGTRSTNKSHTSSPSSSKDPIAPEAPADGLASGGVK